MPRFAGCAVFALVVIALAGCGGGAHKLSKAALGKKANAICVTYSRRVAKLSVPKSADVTALTKYFTDAQKLAIAQQSDLQALKPAKAVEGDWKAFLAQDRQGVTLLQRLAAATKAKDTRTAGTLLGDISTVTGSISSAARKVGAPSCGSAG